MAKDFLFKTIEFSKVERETPYMITRIRPIFSSEVYATYPDEKFEYTSLEKMEAHLLQLLGYTSAQIALLPLESITSYYEPLYNIKWYIGGLFDFMQTARFTSKSSTEVKELFIPLIDDSKIDTAQNELLGFAFPERMMQLIRNKPINRMRMFIKDAILTTETVSELVQYDYFSWITTNQFIPDGAGKTMGIKIKGTNDNTNVNTYLWVVFAPTTNPDAVSTQFNPSHDRYIGISCNNKYEEVKVNKNSGETWPYSWAALPTSESDNNKTSYISLGAASYNCYIRYSNNKNTLSTNSFDSRGSFYQYIGICLTCTGYPGDPNNAGYYKWQKISDFNNIIKYDIDNKRYYLYIRFADSKNVLSDTIIPSNTKNIKISFFNETNNKINNHIYNDIDLYEGTIPYNVFNKYTYNHLGDTKVAWIKFADTLNASGSEGSNHLYDYAIYKDGNTYKIRKYMYISINHDENETVLLDNSRYYKIQLDDLISEYTYSAQIVNENNQSSSYAIYVKFSNSILPPTILENTLNNYSLNYTNYILVSVTDKNGQLHGNTTNNQNSTFDEYEIIVTAREQEISTSFTKNRYAYFTYVDEIADPKMRSQYPVTVVNGENKNKKYFGYSLVNRNPLSNSPRQIQKPDKSSKEITLYRASRLNALTEENITKITSVNIPYSYMGKFAVFNFEPIILNDNEYLIIGGNRDNTCVLTCDDSAAFQWTEEGKHPDYTLKNTDNDPDHGERKIVTGDTSDDDNIMYYTRANFINNTEWSPVYDRYLPIDIGCGYAASSNEVQVTTKSFKDIVEETKINDAVALKTYQDKKQAEAGHYKSPNYDLYVNLTYKFAKIIDGNIDYMPLYNRYKIKYKFKNENQVILEKKVFDTSVITPDGSVYNKPDHIELNGETYGKLTSTYINYFDYIEGEFTDTIKATDVAAEVKDNDYDVAYFQCNNILEQIYQTNYDDVTQGQLFDENYYNYKWLADGGNKDKLPVLCEITISAYDTATPLFTRIVPVTLAAYSLIEVTDDYIRSTVSKIENDYIYGLTQRTSRIELYADRISMSVLNIGQGLYSRMQMTEDRILMEVVDASKQIGSAINMYSDKILLMVYDVSNNMYSQILVEQLKISLEVSNNFRKAGIYLTDNSATIDAPNIILHGNRTTIKGALSIHLLKNDIDGFIMYNLDEEDKIHITVEDIPKFEELGGVSTSRRLYFTDRFDTRIPLTNNKTIDPMSFRIDESTTSVLFFAQSKFFTLSAIKISANIVDPINNRIYKFSNIFDVDNMSFHLYYSLKTSTESINAAGNLLEANIENTNNRNTLNNTEDNIIYGDGDNTPSIVWYDSNNNPLDKNDIDTIELEVGETNWPVLHVFNIPSENIADTVHVNFDHDTDIINNMGVNYDNGAVVVPIEFVYNENKLTYESKYVTITATMSINLDGTLYTDSASFILGVKKASEFYWEYNTTRVTQGICYIDSHANSTLPHIKILGSDITLTDIQFSGQDHGITVNNGYITTTGIMNELDEQNVTITATYNSVSKQCLITKDYYYKSIYIPPTEEIDPDFDDTNKTEIYKTRYAFGQWFDDPVYTISNLDQPRDIKLSLSNNYAYNGIKILLDNLRKYRLYSSNQLSRAGNARYWNEATDVYGNGIDTNFTLYVHSRYKDLADITHVEAPIKGSKTYRIMFTTYETLSYLNFYNIIEIIMPYDTFNEINAIRFYNNSLGDDASLDWGGGRINSGKCIYKRTNADDPFFYFKDELITLSNDFYTSEVSMYDVNIDIVDTVNKLVRIRYLAADAENPIHFTSSIYTNAAIDVHMCASNANYIPALKIYEVNYRYQHQLIWHLQNFGENITDLRIDLLSIYTDLSYLVTAGTRIGQNGMYSYIDEKSLFYFDSSIIALRQGNNGFRFMQEKNGLKYAGSSGIEIYVGDANAYWSSNLWFSMFNYTPLLRFYMEINGYADTYVYKYPEWGYKWNTNTNKWIPDGRITKTNGWAYGRIWALGPNDTNSHYYWCYDPSYHKGMLSMETFCGAAGWDNIITHPKHFILLPTKYYDDNHNLIELPPGYTITIINSQFRKTNRYTSTNKGNHNILEEKGEYGWPRLPLLVSLYIHKYLLPYDGTLSEWDIDTRNNGFTNFNYIKFMHTYRTSSDDGKNWSEWKNYSPTNIDKIAYNLSGKPGNFIDAHGDPCSAIWLTKPNGDYPEEHFMASTHATFIWNGFIWHASCDGDGGNSDYQIENSTDNRD